MFVNNDEDDFRYIVKHLTMVRGYVVQTFLNVALISANCTWVDFRLFNDVQNRVLLSLWKKSYRQYFGRPNILDCELNIEAEKTSCQKDIKESWENHIRKGILVFCNTFTSETNFDVGTETYSLMLLHPYFIYRKNIYKMDICHRV